MNLKMIAAVIGLVFSAASNAGNITPTTNIGGSDLLLNVWEQGAPGGQADQSFTFDLGMTFGQFVANQSTSSATLATLLSTDSTWQGFLASSDTADAGALQWSVIASGNKAYNNTRPAIFGTATVGTDPTTQGNSGFITNSDLNSANTQLGTTINNLNATSAAVAGNANEQVALKGTGAYYQDFTLSNFNSRGFQDGNAIGATGAVWTASNVSGGNTTAAVMTELQGTMTFAQVGGNYVLSYNVPVAAVPEASGVNMALCGLFTLGFLAVRRRNNA
jgi:hypothetical protein